MNRDELSAQFKRLKIAVPESEQDDILKIIPRLEDLCSRVRAKLTDQIESSQLIQYPVDPS